MALKLGNIVSRITNCENNFIDASFFIVRTLPHRLLRLSRNAMAAMGRSSAPLRVHSAQTPEIIGD